VTHELPTARCRERVRVRETIMLFISGGV